MGLNLDIRAIQNGAKDTYLVLISNIILISKWNQLLDLIKLKDISDSVPYSLYITYFCEIIIIENQICLEKI